MSYKLSKQSLSRLTGVNAQLVAVVKRAIEITSVDFTVVEGVRSREQCAQNYGKGRTVAECVAKGVPASYARPALAKVTWLSNPYASRHVTGHAVDLAPFVNGKIDWQSLDNFRDIARAMKSAADELGVAITWGGSWKRVDMPHYEVA